MSKFALSVIPEKAGIQGIQLPPDPGFKHSGASFAGVTTKETFYEFIISHYSL